MNKHIIAELAPPVSRPLLLQLPQCQGQLQGHTCLAIQLVFFALPSNYCFTLVFYSLCVLQCTAPDLSKLVCKVLRAIHHLGDIAKGCLLSLQPHHPRKPFKVERQCPKSTSSHSFKNIWPFLRGLDLVGWAAILFGQDVGMNNSNDSTGAVLWLWYATRPTCSKQHHARRSGTVFLLIRDIKCSVV